MAHCACERHTRARQGSTPRSSQALSRGLVVRSRPGELVGVERLSDVVKHDARAHEGLVDRHRLLTKRDEEEVGRLADERCVANETRRSAELA